MADAVDSAELLDVEVDHLAGPLALIAAYRLGWFQSPDLVEPQPVQDATDGGGGDTELGGDLLAGIALAAQAFDFGAGGQRGLVARRMGARRAIAQAVNAIFAEPLDPLGDGLCRGVELPGGCGLAQPAVHHRSHHYLSTFGRQASIVVAVHSVPPNH